MPKISEEKKLKKKEHIINAAFELFSKKGYSATGMRDIMEAANVSKGGIYVYFESKISILLAIVKRFDSSRHETLNSIDQKLSAEVILSKYLKKRLEAFKLEKNQKWSRIALEFWSLPNKNQELNGIMNNRYNEYKSDIQLIIRHGIEEGIFNKNCSLENIVYQIMSTINGAGVLSSSMGNIITDEQIEATIQMYIKYLKG